MTRRRADRRRIIGVMQPTYRIVSSSGTVYLAINYRHGRVTYWHVFEAQVDAAGRGRRGAHVVAVRRLDEVAAAIETWEGLSIEEVAS
jgi:succinyl-CoA synthetase beta subunit